MPTQTQQKTARFDDAARRERLASPAVIQATGAVRHPGGGSSRYPPSGRALLAKTQEAAQVDPAAQVAQEVTAANRR